ncbi:MAG: RNA-binding S4 domain-containing protein [bacterium]
MRLDKFLKVSRIIKRRTLSKEIAEASRVKVNDKVAKPSTQVAVGDEIEIEFGRSILKVRVLMLKEHVLKDESSQLYEVIEEVKKPQIV